MVKCSPKYGCGMGLVCVNSKCVGCTQDEVSVTHASRYIDDLASGVGYVELDNVN